MGKRPSKMNTSTDSMFAKLKGRNSTSSSLSPGKDENSKKKKKPKKMPPTAAEVRHPLKSVKVLVERTKFNEMHILDRSKAPLLKLVNGKSGLDKKRGRPLKKRFPLPVKTQPKKKSINGLFRIRKCYVKLSKDKVLQRLQDKLAAKSKPTRGRPKKRMRGKRNGPTTLDAAADAGGDSPMTTVTPTPTPTTGAATTLKRKSTDNADNLPPKRSRKAKPPKGTEFFINIGALTRTPSPRRRTTQSTSPEDGNKRKGLAATKKPTSRKAQKATALRNKFGNRFFKSYVKVHRIRDPSRVAANDSFASEKNKKKKNGKNLSVSFLETVEIFGESSEGEDWADFEDTSLSSTAKASRLKRLENGTTEEDPAKPFSTSTPCGSRSTPEKKTGGILKRKEKISFSPLKEDEPSPRKEQLKLANEKIVRLSLEQPPAVEEDEREAVSENQQPESDEATPAVVATSEDDVDDSNKNNVEDERHNSNESIRPSSPIEPELITPPSLAEKDESTDHENVMVTNEQEQEDRLENQKNLSEEIRQTPPIESKNEPPGTIFEKDKEDEESFKSAIETSLSLEKSNADEEPCVETIEEGMQEQTDSSEKLQVSYVESHSGDGIENLNDEGDDEVLQNNEEPIESHPDETEVNETDEQPTIHEEEEEEDEEISETNQVNISNTSDQHFEDASELVATALLDDEERNEADAVLNDVCQMAAAESAGILSEDASGSHLGGEVSAYDSRPNDVGDDDDDFTSVLTHPEVERSLQSAASTLVPNSQEIVVAAAAAASSQNANDIDVTEDTFASVVAEVERLTKDVNPEIYSEDVGITGDDVMMDNVQASNSLDDIFDDDDDDDIISSLRMSSGNIDIGHDKSLPIQVIETEVMAIPNEPDLIFDKPLGTTASILGTPMASTNDTLAGHGHCSTTDTNSKISLGRIFQSVKSYMMSPGGEKNATLQD